MRRMLVSALGLVVVAYAVTAAPARAVTIATTVAPMLTLDSAVAVSNSGGTYTMLPISSEDLFLKQLGGSVECLGGGTCDALNQDWIVFDVSIDSGNLGSLSVTLLDSFVTGLNAVGMGYYLDGGPVQNGSGSTDTYAGTLADPDVPVFSFTANGGGAGLTGDGNSATPDILTLFVAYADGTLPQTPSTWPPPNDTPGRASFMVATFTAASGTNQGNFTTVVPEPGTGLLLGLGVALLATYGRRRRG